MDKPKDNIDFRLMSLTYKLRDFFRPCMSILKEVGIEPGFTVLDYGCGPGSYIVPTAELVGRSGRIYALDIHPPAINSIKNIIVRRRLTNVETIQSDCKTGLPNASVDIILLYDIFHDLGAPHGVLKELHRVLKPGGILSFSDHHMKEDEIISRVTKNGLFKLLQKGERTYSFGKRD